MATPGPITGRQSRGTHELIRSRRAELVASADDVVELLEPLGSPSTDPGGSETLTPATTALIRHLGEEAVSVLELANAVNLTQSQTLAGLELLRAQSAADLTIDGWRRSTSRNR